MIDLAVIASLISSLEDNPCIGKYALQERLDYLVGNQTVSRIDLRVQKQNDWALKLYVFLNIMVKSTQAKHQK